MATCFELEYRDEICRINQRFVLLPLIGTKAAFVSKFAEREDPLLYRRVQESVETGCGTDGLTLTGDVRPDRSKIFMARYLLGKYFLGTFSAMVPATVTTSYLPTAPIS